ncbi:MAG: hypothetical protein BGO09_01340 [Bacteroidetes bacterium 47-18]|nr:MAG: hypothetical protein BGO09_01340 [Bacteroidetes bacterium 47-18]
MALLTISLNLIFVTAALLFSLLILKERQVWKIFFPYLLVVLITESYGAYLRLSGIFNSYVYNIFMPIYLYTFSLILLYILKAEKLLRYKYLLLSSIVLFYVFIFYRFGISKLLSEILVTSNFIFSILCLIYLYRLMSDNLSINILKLPEFWIVVGILVYSFGSITVWLFMGLLNTIYQTMQLPLRQIIMLFLNGFLYGSWSYAFLCKYQQKIS